MESNQKYYCHFLSNKNRTVLYIGYTDNLKRRISQHASGNGALFTKKYNVIELVYFECYSEKKVAKKREFRAKELEKRLEMGFSERK